MSRPSRNKPKPRRTKASAADAAERLDPRAQRKRDRADRTRNAILAAAAEVLANAGMASMTMEQVAKQAGYSVGSLYNYFQGKEALITALGVSMMGESLAAIQRPLPPSLNAHQRMEMLVMRMLENVERSRGWLLRLVQDGSMHVGLKQEAGIAEVQKLMDAVDEVLESHVREVIAEGAARAVDPQLGAAFIASTIRGLVFEWMRRGGQQQVTDLAPLIVELVFEGLGARDERKG